MKLQMKTKRKGTIYFIKTTGQSRQNLVSEREVRYKSKLDKYMTERKQHKPRDS